MELASKYDPKVENSAQARKILEAHGWKSVKTIPKSKYFCVRGSKHEKEEILSKLEYPIKPYPKRGISQL